MSFYRYPAFGTGSGTVTSVGLSLPSIFSVSGSPVTTTGTLSATLINETANFIFSGPTSGGAAGPTFRALVPADIPNLSASKITSGQGSITTSTTGLTVGTGTNSTLVNVTIDVQTATAAQPGLLAAADFVTFNSKQAAGNYITALTSDVTATGPGSVAATVAFVGGASAASVATATAAANAASSSNAPSTIVIRDIAGDFSAGVVTADLVGNVTGNVSGTSANVTGTVAIANGGTGQVTANAALNALLPSQTGKMGQVLQSDGTDVSWSTPVTAIYTTGAGQTFLNGVEDRVDFGTMETDNYSAVVTGASWLFTVPAGEPGIYMISVTIDFLVAVGGDGLREVNLYKNGSLVVIATGEGSQNIATQINLVRMLSLAVGDTLYATGQQNSGFTTTLNPTGTANSISIVKVS